MATVGDRCRARREELGWSQPFLARKVNEAAGEKKRPVKQQHIDQLERGETRRPRYLLSLARALGVHPEWLESGRGSKLVDVDGQVQGGLEESQVEYAAPPKASQLIEFNGDTYVAIQRYEIQASAGPGRTLPGMPAMLHQLIFRVAWLRRVTSAPFNQLAVIEIDGDSMEPTLRTGDVVLVDLTERNPARKDAIYVINRDGELQAKRLQCSFKTRRITVVSDNPAYLPEPDIEPSEIEVVGRIVWTGRRI